MDKTTATDQRLIGLDFVRGIAALGVAIAHFYSKNADSPVAEAVAAVSVELFFPLSGFVLASQLSWVCKNPGNLNSFYIRRWFRTLLPYFIALVMAATVTKNLFTRDFLLYALFIQDSAPNILNSAFYPIAWSLAVEEWFYLIFPLFLIAYCRGGKGVMGAALTFVGIMQVAKIIAVIGGLGLWVRIATPLRLDAIALGFILFQFKDRRVGGIWLGCLLAALGGLTVFWSLPILAGIASGWQRLLFIDGLMITSTLLIWLAYRLEPSSSPRAITEIAVWAGRISFPVYLFHLFFVPMAVKLGSSSVLLGVAIYLLSVIGFAIGFHILVERPMLSSRPGYTKSTQASCAVVSG